MMMNGMEVVKVEELDPTDPEAVSQVSQSGISKPVPEDIPSIAVIPHPHQAYTLTDLDVIIYAFRLLPSILALTRKLHTRQNSRSEGRKWRKASTQRGGREACFSDENNRGGLKLSELINAISINSFPLCLFLLKGSG
ncbi:hypothetical protein RRG08_010346 [Elysia crispata]|uniref:Uncharacterized protein n=1 Tax=Elysia crispata TaxID=231223 RepID=A0AAE1E8D0_9GAST|nr:hypothetical protein RRG08_010346 [Elysia crispata]